MNIQKIKKLTANRKNCMDVVEQVKETFLTDPESIDWDQLLDALNRFPDTLRESQQYTQLWDQEETEPILQIFTSCIVHRRTYTARFGKLCTSPYSRNIRQLALDYRDEDEDWVGEGAFIRSPYMQNLERLRIKNHPFSCGAFMEHIENFPKLKLVQLVGDNCADHDLASFLEERGVTVVKSRSAIKF
ncbi:MAG: hypothetical protein AAGD96_08910 [Chloroflexota bacterium]